jgi:hypothetical protein
MCNNLEDEVAGQKSHLLYLYLVNRITYVFLTAFEPMESKNVIDLQSNQRAFARGRILTSL